MPKGERALTRRIFLANVGANASHRFRSPIYPDGTFELITIPEDLDLPGRHAVRYKDIRSFYHPEESLRHLVPRKFWDWPTHYDPEFETLTYGDNCETTARAVSLKKVEPGDFLFFIARLNHWNDNGPTDTFGFYLVGYLEIDSILKDVKSRPSKDVMDRYQANAHVIRGLSDPTLWDRFWVFAGTQNSKRFQKAVPVTREFADEVFTRADGSPWEWEGKRSELQVIGSYTRTCRCVIDPTHPLGEERETRFWQWVESHRG